MDTIASRIGIEETTELIDKTGTTVAVTLDGWKSQTSLLLLENATWSNSDFKVYRACLDFVQITESLRREYGWIRLQGIILKRHNCLTKLLTTTADNASSDSTVISIDK